MNYEYFAKFLKVNTHSDEKLNQLGLAFAILDCVIISVKKL